MGVLSIALVSSTYLPVSVCGTGTSSSNALAAFLGSVGSTTLAPHRESWSRPYPWTPGICRRGRATTGHGPCPLGPLASTLLRPRIACCWWERNINRLSIAYTLPSRLRPA